MLESFRQFWRGLRFLSGDDAYERYLTHWRQHHAREGLPPLDRKAFFDAEMRRRWSGIKRCC